MEKDSVLWFFSNQILRKLISVIIFAFLIIVVSAPDALAVPDGSRRSAIASETEMQQISVSGKITDAATGEALPGVNIVLEGTTIGTISDPKGEYTLSPVDRNGILKFSFIGYVNQSIAVSGRVMINVALHQETTGLEEVVVIGYGTQRKETLTGSVASIKTDQILSTKTLSLAGAIQGKIPGVQIRQQTGQPGTFNSRISVRGFGDTSSGY